MERKIDLKSMITKLILSGLLIAFCFAIIYLVMDHFHLNIFEREKIQNLIQSTGFWGPFVFIFLSFLQVTFLPIPSSLTIVIGNYLFGFWPSFLYSYIGILIGSLFAFYLGKILGRKFINWVVGDAETVDYYLKKLNGKEIILLFFMFLFPMFPDDALCALAGILPITMIQFIFMQLITRFTSILGSLLFLSGEFIPYTPFGITLMVILSLGGLVVFFICMKYSTAINNTFNNIINKLFNSHKKEK